MTKKAIAPKPAKVYCSDCSHFVRDTEGISRNIETGEYFMGICNKGLTPDGCKKVFANHLRICTEHQTTKQ